MTPPPRRSIAPTYDSRETGPRFHVTVRLNGDTIVFQEPADDPFVRETVVAVVSPFRWPQWLFRRTVRVEVLVDGDREIIEDVTELDANYHGRPGSTRHAEFGAALNTALGQFGGEQ